MTALHKGDFIIISFNETDHKQIFFSTQTIRIALIVSTIC